MNDQRPSLTQLGFGAVLVAVIAALLGLRPGGEPGKPAEKPAAAKAVSAEAPAPVSGNEPHRRFVLDFLYPPPIPAPAATPKQEFQAVQANDIVCLIVTVADPVDTPFGYWFDQIVESMTRAAGAFKYSPAGHWLPWEAYERGIGNPDAKSREQGRPSFGRYPGVMLFRHRDPTRTLIVLLVGETVNGIRAEALKRALNLVHEIDVARTRQDNKVRLVAPFFSGAQAGLFQAMAEWSESIPKKPAQTFDVISGSANGIDLTESKDTNLPPSPLERFMQKHLCQFRSTMIPAEIQQRAILKFLMNPQDRAHPKEVHADYDRSNVAILIESNTGFGGGRQQHAATEREKLHAAAGRPKQVAARLDTKSPLYLTFPMRLASIQARYAQQRAEQEKRIAGSDVWLPAEGQSQQPRLNPDMVPTLDEATTPRLDDRGIDDITAAIRRNRIRFVGLSATDPQDVVTLVERIKRDCSNVQIFVTGMDLIYALPENRNTMRGVVISSTYPLYPTNQEWANPNDRVRQTFMSESAQGCYNAAVFHLAEAMPSDASGRTDYLQEYSPPVFADPGRPMADWSKPPVWVFTMGENGRYVPNDFYFYEPIPTPPQMNHKPRDPRELMACAPACDQDTCISWPTLGAYAVPVTLLVLGAAGVLFWIIAGRSVEGAPPFPALTDMWHKDGWQKLLQWVSAPMPAGEQRAAIWQNLALTVVVVCLVPVATTAGTLLGPSYDNRPWLPVVSLVLIGGAALVMTVIGILLQVRLFLRLRQYRPAWRLRRNGLVSLAGWALAVWMLAAWCVSASWDRVLFAERASLVETGYSVMPPLLLLAAGFVALAYYALRRHYLDQCFRIDCPYPPECDKQFAETVDPIIACSCQRISKKSRDLQKELASLRDFSTDRGRWLLVAGIGSLLAVWPYWHYCRPTYEGLVWDVTFLIAFLVLTFGAVFNTVRLLACWQGLEGLLNTMALLPMAQAFERVPPKVADLFGGYFWTHRPRLEHLVIPLSMLRQLRHEAASAAKAEGMARAQAQADPEEPALAILPEFDRCPARIADNLNLANAWPDPRDVKVEAQYPVKALNTLSQDARDVIHQLARYWPHHSIADAYGDDAPDRESKDTPEDSAKPTAHAIPGHHSEDETPYWVQKAEDFVTVQTVVFLSPFFIQLRELAACAVSVSVLLLAAATIYPFQPEQLIMYLVFVLLLAVAASIVWVLVRVNKNEIVSRVTRSTPNRFALSWSFVAGMVQYVGPIVLVMILSMSGRMRTLGEPFLNLIR